MSKPVFNAERSPRLLHAEETVSPVRRQSYFSELIETVFPRDFDPRSKPVLFTSPTPGAGGSFICSYIAAELAGQGGRILLADVQALGSLARRSVEDAGSYPERVETSRLWVLGARQAMARPLEKGGGPAATAGVLAALREEFTHILLDAPALSVSDEAMSLASAVHGTVLIAQAGATAKSDIARARDQFVSLGGRVLGSIYNARPAGMAGESRA